MRLPLFFFFCMIFFVSAKGQRNYQQAIDSGDHYYYKPDFKKAINYYFAAEAFDPTKKDSVKIKVNKAFDAIEALRIKSVDAEMQTKIANEKALASLKKANNLIDAFYFYDDKFALAYKNDKFYFIDKNGIEVTKLGKWKKAEQFDKTGFAKVKDDENGGLLPGASVFDKTLHSYLIDTSGNSYESVNNIKNIDSSIMVLDLSNQTSEHLPPELFTWKQLKVLLFPNGLDSLPKEINELTNLIYLDLSDVSVEDRSIKQFGKLTNLISLNMSHSGGDFSNFLEGIGNFKKLTTLNLSFNPENSGELPKEIWGLKKLTNLNLYWCQLGTLPPEIGELTELTNLDLGLNTLFSLPKEIGKLKKLTNLDLSGNFLTGLPKEIWGLTNLRTLNLYNNKDEGGKKFSIPESELKQIRAHLPNCKIITGIDPFDDDD